MDMNWTTAKFVDVPVDELVSPALDWAVGYMLNRAPHILYTLALRGNLLYSVQGDILETAIFNKVLVIKDGSMYMARSAQAQVHADSPQVAAMRCMLKTRYGETVQVPQDLIGLPFRGQRKPQMRFMDYMMPRLEDRHAPVKPAKPQAQHQETELPTKPVKTNEELLDELQQVLLNYNPDE